MEYHASTGSQSNCLSAETHSSFVTKIGPRRDDDDEEEMLQPKRKSPADVTVQKRDDGVVVITHAAGNLRLMYVRNFIPEELAGALLSYIRAQPFLPKVGAAQFQAYPHVSKNYYRWEVDSSLPWHDRAFYNFSRQHHAPLPPTKMGDETKTLVRLAWMWARANIPALDPEMAPNAALWNWYPNGGAQLSAHSDNDPMYGNYAVMVLSFSLLTVRKMRFRIKQPGNPQMYSLELDDRSLLAMVGADTQRNYTHEITKASDRLPERFNITLRHIKPEYLSNQHEMRAKTAGYGAANVEQMYGNAYTRAIQAARRPDGQPVASLDAQQLNQKWWTVASA